MEDLINNSSWIAVQAVLAINEDNVMQDIDGTILTPDMIYDKYWDKVNKKSIFKTLVQQVNMKHEVIKQEDERKKKLFHLLLEQPDVDFEGYKTKYILKEDASSELKRLLTEGGQESTIVEEDPNHYQPGFLCRDGDVNIYVVESYRNRITKEQYLKENKFNPHYELGS